MNKRFFQEEGEGSRSEDEPEAASHKLALGRRMHEDVDVRYGRLRVGVLIRWLVRVLVLEVLLRRGVPFIWRKYRERRERR